MKKILLAILPYWDPLIPPNGIATLKSYLVKKGFEVKTRDIIVEKEFQELYDRYFDLLRENINESHHGNLYNMGHEMLTDHMTAHINHRSEGRYMELVKQIVYLAFYVRFDNFLIKKMNGILTELFSRLGQYFYRWLEEEKPDVLGLTAYKGTLPAVMFVFRKVKEKFPHLLTAMGGGMFADSHAVGSPNYYSVLKKTEPYIDKIIIGQGELLFEKLLKGELPGNQRVFSRKDIGERVLEFHEQELPDYSDFDVARYPLMPLTSSTSCLYGCSFCCYSKYWGKYRKKAPGQVLREMKELHRRYGCQLFTFTDSLGNPVLDDLAEELIKANTSLYYDYFLRVSKEVAKIENTMKWRRSGLFRVRIGAESGSQRVLDLMNKKITPALTKAAVSALAYAGIKTTLYWVIGHPGETEEDFQLTLQLLEELKNDIYQAEAAPIKFHHSGQTNSTKWQDKLQPLYPESVKDMMVSQPWTIDCEPSREERHNRMFRFAMRCKKLGIPNPYTLQENFQAGQRWKKLHKNAVPGLHEFRKSKTLVTENLNVRLTTSAKDTRVVGEDDGFCF